MPYKYHESTTLSQQNATALRSLAATGTLPNNHYWNALRARHDANPTRFDRANIVLGTLLDRDQAQRQGTLAASAPLFSRTGFFAYAGGKHDLSVTRFDHYHPFLGRLFELIVPQPTIAPLPVDPAGQGVTPPTTPTTPTTPPTDPPGNNLPPSDGTDTGTIVNPPIPHPSAVPEPASALLMSLALVVGLVFVAFKRRSDRQVTRAVAQPVGV